MKLGRTLLCCVALSCGPPPSEQPPSGTARETSSGGWFRDVTAASGIDFVHQDGRSGQRYYVETSASGGGWLDFDGDGDLDLYLVNGAATPGSELAAAPQNRLYEQRDGRFVDVTDAAGVGDTGYGMGLCVGDVDADGHVDFLVTNYGADRLFRNRGDGTFEEIAAAAGVAGDRWGTGCAFSDLDGDGDLDLYVVNYVAFSYARNPRCGDAARDLASYCRPAVFDGQADYLYLNQGVRDGAVRFIEDGAARGIAQGSEEKGYGVAISDLDGDGDQDLVVTNDETPNRLYVNDGTGRFVDRSLEAGLALDRDGRAESSMGLDLGDVDGDGRLDVLMTHYAFETNTLYFNRGDLTFYDLTSEAGLAAPSYLRVGWGVGFFDMDNDGDLDAAVANGHLLDNVELFESAVSYEQPNQLFENDGTGVFRDVSQRAGPALKSAGVSRGLAVGDWNDDGRLDLLVTHTNAPPELLENTSDSGFHWLGLRLHGGPANPLAIGARVMLRDAERRLLGVREVTSGGSFLSQPDLRLHFGLGALNGPVVAEIRWPDGCVQAQAIEVVDRYLGVRYNRESCGHRDSPRPRS